MFQKSNKIDWRLWVRINLLIVAAACVVVLASSGFVLAGQVPAEAPFLDGSHARRAFLQVEDWVAKGQAPAAGGAVEPIWVSDLTGVRVTLRWMGMTMGSGQSVMVSGADSGGGRGVTSTGGSQASLGAVVDLAELARVATAIALEQVKQTAQDARFRAQRKAGGGEGKPDDPAAVLAKIGPLLMVDLQLARPQEPVILAAEDPDQKLYRGFAPGYHGLRLSHVGEDGLVRAEAWDWPANALAANLTPHSQLVQMLTAMNLPWQSVRWIGRAGGSAEQPVAGQLRLTRFEVVHLVRTGPDEPVTELVRGNVVLPGTSVNDRTLRAMSGRLVEHLMRKQRSDGQMAGTYRPTSDSYEPQTAALHDVALAGYALGRHLRLLKENSPKDSQVAVLERSVRRTAEYVAHVLALGGGADPSGAMSQEDAAAAALLVLTIVDAPNLSDMKSIRDSLVAGLAGRGGAKDQESDAVPAADSAKASAGDDAGAGQVKSPVRALILDALCGVYQQTNDSKLLPVIDRLMNDLFVENTKQARRLASTLPWSADAMRRLRPAHPSGRQDGEQAPNEPATARKLNELATLLRAAQVGATPGAAPEAGPGDSAGGYDLARRSADEPANPDWHSAQYLAFLAAEVGREGPAAKPEQMMKKVIECGLAARFLAQLMFDEPSCFYVRSREDAMGGVRMSLWDNQVGVGPTAMTLLAVTELRQTLAGITQPR